MGEGLSCQQLIRRLTSDWTAQYGRRRINVRRAFVRQLRPKGPCTSLPPSECAPLLCAAQGKTAHTVYAL